LTAIEGAIQKLESEICRRFKVDAAVCVPMARTGIYLTLREVIHPGQTVIMSPLTIIDVVNAVLAAGGIPVFADICRKSCAIDPGRVESLLDKRTGAVLVTHLHGQSAGAHAFRDVCIRRGVPLIEDAAQAFGAIESGRHLGTIGDAGIYSFGFFKNLPTWRGGMVVSNNRGLIASIRSHVRKLARLSMPKLLLSALTGLTVDLATWPPLFSKLTYQVVRRNFGFVNRWLDPESSASRLKHLPEDYLLQMREWQATIALRQIVQVDQDAKVRLGHAAHYHDGLARLPEIIKPEFADDLSNIYTYFPIQIQDRQRLLQYAQLRGRDFAPQYLRNCADLADFREFYRDCPNARAAASELVLLPTYPRYPATEVERNVEVLREYLQ
jgi:dTDP-4-amino-4,6-dideoxygalactose transaminase